MIIIFEDNGQPYKEWKLDDEGQIIECMPAYNFFWLGKYVFLPETLTAGQHLFYNDTQITASTKTLKALRHKIKAITNHFSNSINMNIIENEILAITREVRKKQVAYFATRNKETLKESKALERQLDNLIVKADALNASKVSNNEFEISIKIEFDEKGEMIMRPEFPGRLVAATAIDALVSSATNLQQMINGKSDEAVRKSTILISELFS